MTDQTARHSSGRLRVAALVTTFNRRETTVANLGLLAELAPQAGMDLRIFVVDDLSPDGTADAVRREISNAVVADGTGSLFWCGGTARAYALARSNGPWDAYMLFNDDVQVTADGVRSLVSDFTAADGGDGVVMVGSCLGSDGLPTYSGYLRPSRSRPLRMELCPPHGSVLRCDTFNGNVVLLAAVVMERLGGVDRRYIHMFGDLDLGLRAAESGAVVLVASHPVGTCVRGASPQQRVSGKGALARASVLFRGPFGILPVARFAFRHGTPVSAPLVICRSLLARVAIICGLPGRL